jgi:DNA-binding NarL/FixJ family response regulator
MKIRLLLADDHPLIREGFKSLLGKSDAFEIVHEADNGLEVIRSVDHANPDVILTDINMPQMNGLQLIEKLTESHPQIRFIVLTMHEEREYVLKALKAGADGYLLKSAERPELENAIKTVFAGGKYFSPQITTLLAESVSGDKEELPELTPREKEVLQLVAKGHSTKQIADKLSISIRTVESHRINMLKKMGVSNSAELIRKSMELGMLD